MAIIITAPNEDYSVATIAENTKLFLGGGITNCPDWQQEIIDALKDYNHLTIYNPRRPNFSPADEEPQICWEYDKLAKANVIIFWFPKETVCPITLYELGKWGNATDTKIIIGMHPDYPRKNDVIIQTSLARPSLDVYVGFESFMYAVEWILK